MRWADSVSAGHGVCDAVLTSTDAGRARAVCDALPFGIRASAKAVLVENSRFVAEAAFDRIRQGFEASAGAGRHLLAVGKNEEGARYSGINTRRVTVSAYALSMFLTAVSAVFFAMYTRSVQPASHGNFYELYGIAAAVLGGFSLRGGEGSIVGVVLGVILLQVLQNLVNLLGIPSSLNFAVMGSVILIGVIADTQFSAFRERRRHFATMSGLTNKADAFD